MDVIPGEFGYVIIVMISSIFLLQWLGYKVVVARKKYEVQVRF